MTDGERAAAWQRDGYLMVRDAIAPEYLEPIRAFIGERVDAFARQRHAAGDIATPHEQEPFGRRYAAIHEELSAPATVAASAATGVRRHRPVYQGAVRPLHPPGHHR